MLVHLRMQNIALIDDVSLDFEDGFMVLTGETGAGKSILLDGINLALGTRAQRELLRPESGPSQVDLLFSDENGRLSEILSSLGIKEEDGEILMTRSFSETGRSVCRVNGQIVTASTMKEIARYLIDIHGQHEHQSLLDPASHLAILDRYDERIQQAKGEYHDLYLSYQAVAKELKGYLEEEQDKERLLSLMQYEREEIEQAHLRNGEEDELKALRRKLYNSERMQSAVQEALSSLYEGENEPSASDLLGRALHALHGIEDADPDTLKPLTDSLEEASAVLEDIGYQLRTYADDLDMDPQLLEQTEERLNLIRKIQSKYGQTPEKVNAYYEDLLERIDKLEHIQRTKEELENKKNNIEKKLSEKASVLRKLRKEAADTLSREVTALLGTLQFNDPLFAAQILEEDTFRSYGTESVEFRIRTNVGDKVKPLHMIASGGEMSRIMLAIKTVLARKDEIPTLIFDEIDSGISGRTAQSVAQKMAQIASYHQVLCVTHLPQIAAMADHHYGIEKVVEDGHTRTKVLRLDREQMIDELARLTGGAAITETVRKSARELKDQADGWKHSLREVKA